MFPIRDHNPSLGTPYVTYVLLAANLGVYLYTLSFYGNEVALSAFYYDFAMIPGRVTLEGYYSSLLTHMFLHGSVFHLAGNMLFLWIFGDNLEDQFGHLGYAAFYLATGVAAAGAQYMFDRYSPVPMVGASGAIAGVMGGYLLFFPRARVDILLIFIIFYRIVAIPAYVMLGLWFAFQIIGGLGTLALDGGIAYWAHAGGFVMGLVLAYPVWKQKGAATFWSRTSGHPPHPKARYVIGRTTIPRVPRKRR